MNFELATQEPTKDAAISLVRDFIRAGYHHWPAGESYHFLAVQLSGQLHATVSEHALDEAVDHYRGYLEADDTTPDEIADFYEQKWQPGLADMYRADITRNLTEAFNTVLPARYGIITDPDTEQLFTTTTNTLRSAA